MGVDPLYDHCRWSDHRLPSPSADEGKAADLTGLQAPASRLPSENPTRLTTICAHTPCSLLLWRARYCTVLRPAFR